MPTISGYVYYNSDRVFISKVGIPNIPVLLCSKTSNFGVVALTTTSGYFEFNNVPADSYSLVEVYGYQGGLATPVNFQTNLSTITSYVPKDPPVSAISSVASGVNRIDSITPNTLNITVTTTNLTSNVFYDSPVIDIPATANDLTILSGNLITAANNGLFLTNPAGTAANYSPLTNPYPSVITPSNASTGLSFTYTSLATAYPADGSLTVCNMMNTQGNADGWWNATNQYSGNETGGMLLVNGANPGAVFFQQTVSNVTPNTYYYFSTWISNLCKAKFNYVPPKLGILISDSNQVNIFQTTLTNIPGSNISTWNQVGGFFNSGTNTTLSVSFYSAGPAATGNDFAISSISLTPVNPNPILSVTQTVNKTEAAVGDILTYTYNVSNGGTSTAQNIVLKNTLPSNCQFLTGSIYINGVSQPSLTMTSNQLPLSNLGDGASTTVSFQARVASIPNPTTVTNIGNVAYTFVPIINSSSISMNAASNTVSTLIDSAYVTPTLTADHPIIEVGDTVTYTVNVLNNSQLPVNNVKFSPTFSSNLTYVANSVSGGFSGTPSTGFSIGTLAVNQSASFTFKMICNELPATSQISASGAANYTYTLNSDHPDAYTGSNNTSTTITEVQLSQLVAQLSPSGSILSLCDIIPFSLTVSNTGTVDTTNVVIPLTLPNTLQLQTSCVKINGQATSLSSTNTITIPIIKVGSSSLITFSGQVVKTILPNTVNMNMSYQFNYSLTSDSVIVKTKTGSSNSIAYTVNIQ